MQDKNPIEQMLQENKIQGYINQKKFASMIPNPRKFIKKQAELCSQWQAMQIQKTIGKTSEQLRAKWKPLMRKGIPLKYQRQVLLKLYDINPIHSKLRYQKAEQTVFHGSIPQQFKEVPTFTSQETVEQILEQNHALTYDGLQALKRLLWIFSQQYEIQFSPHIIRVLSLLLLVLSEDEAFILINNILQNSKKRYRNDDIRWHFTFFRKDFDKIINAWVASYTGTTFKGKRSILEHASKIGVEFRQSVQHIFEKFFFGFFNIEIVMSIFSAFMNEGIKIVFRYLYSFFKCLKEQVHKIKQSSIYMERLKLLGASFVDVQIAIKHAFKYNLKKKNNTYGKQDEVEYTTPLKSKVFFIPHFQQPSEILSQADIQVIWEWIPNVYKISNPICKFSTMKDGYSLNSLYLKCNEIKSLQGKTPFLMAIKTVDKRIFGLFTNKSITVTGKDYMMVPNSFVYTLNGPKQGAEYWQFSNKNDYVMKGTKQAFTFGAGGNGPAIHLESNLESGQTHQSQTFQNQPLTGNGQNFFKIACLELFLLQ